MPHTIRTDFRYAFGRIENFIYFIKQFNRVMFPCCIDFFYNLIVHAGDVNVLVIVPADVSLQVGTCPADVVGGVYNLNGNILGFSQIADSLHVLCKILIIAIALKSLEAQQVMTS